jgi:hypothetical protein
LIPPALAERAEETTREWTRLREHLSAEEWDRFNVQFYEARHDDPSEFQRLLESWLITVAIRSHPSYEKQFAGFMSSLESVA